MNYLLEINDFIKTTYYKKLNILVCILYSTDYLLHFMEF